MFSSQLRAHSRFAVAGGERTFRMSLTLENGRLRYRLKHNQRSRVKIHQASYGRVAQSLYSLLNDVDAIVGRQTMGWKPVEACYLGRLRFIPMVNSNYFSIFAPLMIVSAFMPAFSAGINIPDRRFPTVALGYFVSHEICHRSEFAKAQQLLIMLLHFLRLCSSRFNFNRHGPKRSFISY